MRCFSAKLGVHMTLGEVSHLELTLLARLCLPSEVNGEIVQASSLAAHLNNKTAPRHPVIYMDDFIKAVMVS
jgi:hypothetical protein